MDPPILAKGQILADKYRVLRMIGRGGMAEVYAAHHEILHQTVALKVLLPGVASIPGAATRFLNEARSAARIRSEHVAAVMDVGMRDDGSAYIVLEYLEGEDLQQVVDRRGPLPSSEVVDYVLQALEALAHAHSLGIVHRDLKPSNIFLARGAGGVTVVKVFDFGISKAPRTTELADQSSTASQIILGTPSYMSPEQARSARDVDSRADIWALGVILYRLLTGTLPFVADNIADMLAQIIVHPHSSMRKHRPELSLELDAIVSRCLGKERELRFASVAELAQALSPHATVSGRGSVDRISRTLGLSSSPRTASEAEKTDQIPAPSILASTAVPPAGAPVAAATKLDARTDSGWMEASAVTLKGSKARLWAAGGGIAALLGAALLVLRPARAPVDPGAVVVKEPALVAPRAASSFGPLPSFESSPSEPARQGSPITDAAVPPAVPALPASASIAASAPAASSSPNPPRAAASGNPASASSSSPARSAHPAPHPVPTASAAASAHGYDVLDQRN